jgi:hypothetical protein
MSKNIEYIVVEANSTADLEMKIKNYLNEEWELLGGVSVTSVRPPMDLGSEKEVDDPLFTFAQAMVRPIKGEFQYA